MLIGEDKDIRSFSLIPILYVCFTLVHDVAKWPTQYPDLHYSKSIWRELSLPVEQVDRFQNRLADFEDVPSGNLDFSKGLLGVIFPKLLPRNGKLRKIITG